MPVIVNEAQAQIIRILNEHRVGLYEAALHIQKNVGAYSKDIEKINKDLNIKLAEQAAQLIEADSKLEKANADLLTATEVQQHMADQIKTLTTTNKALKVENKKLNEEITKNGKNSASRSEVTDTTSDGQGN
jgi:regulator of replication initiation timing